MTDDDLSALDFEPTTELSEEEKMLSALIGEFDETLAELRVRHAIGELTSEEELIGLVVDRYKDRPQEELRAFLAIALTRQIQAKAKDE